jgi:hypothetical protein
MVELIGSGRRAALGLAYTCTYGGYPKVARGRTSDQRYLISRQHEEEANCRLGLSSVLSIPKQPLRMRLGEMIPCKMRLMQLASFISLETTSK